MPEGLRAIDCDVHPMVPAMSALAPVPRRVLARPGGGARHHPARRPELADQGAQDDPRRLARREGPRRRHRRGAPDPGAGALRRRPRHPQPALRRADGAERRHGGGLHPRAERLDARGVAGPRRPAARLHRAALAGHRRRGGGDRAPRPRPPLRPGAWCSPWATRRSASGSSGPSTRPASGTACRSASTPAAPTSTRRPRSAGPPGTWRSTPPTSRPSRASSPPSSPRARSASSPT